MEYPNASGWSVDALPISTTTTPLQLTTAAGDVGVMFHASADFLLITQTSAANAVTDFAANKGIPMEAGVYTLGIPDSGRSTSPSPAISYFIKSQGAAVAASATAGVHWSGLKDTKG